MHGCAVGAREWRERHAVETQRHRRAVCCVHPPTQFTTVPAEPFDTHAAGPIVASRRKFRRRRHRQGPVGGGEIGGAAWYAASTASTGPCIMLRPCSIQTARSHTLWICASPCETKTTVVPLWMRSRNASPDFCW